MNPRAARHLTLLAAITAASVPLLMMLYHLLAFDPAAIAVLCAGTVMVAAPFLLRAGAPLPVARDVFIGGLFALKIWLAIHLGGLSSATTGWFILCPLVAALLGGPRPALVWAALVFKVYVLLFLWTRFVAPLVPYPVTDPALLALGGQLGLLALATIIACLFHQQPTRGQVQHSNTLSSMEPLESSVTQDQNFRPDQSWR